MKKAMRFLIPALLALVLSCDLDGWGWLISSDVDDRYRDNMTMFVGVPGDLNLTPPFSFVVIADTHIFEGNDTAARFAALDLDIAAHGDEFVLACGDLVQDGALADFQTFADANHAGGLGVPVFAVPGNHDLYNNGWPNYRDEIGPSMYSFSTGAVPGSVRIIAVDSANGTLGAPQRAWLEGVLAARTEQFCVTFTHFQFFANEITESQQWTDINEIYSLMHLLETSGVNIHFAGHTHAYFARTINGTTYCTAPGFGRGYVRVNVTVGGVSYEVLEF